MHVCFLTGEYPPMQGGVADHTEHLARHLSQAGWTVSVLTSTKARSAQPQPPDDVAVHPVITGWGPSCWQQIGLYLASRKPDVLHIQYQAAAFDLTGWVNWLPHWITFSATIRALSRRPQLVVTFHDLRIPYVFPKAGPLRWRAILSLARGSDTVITTNVQDELTLKQYEWAAGRVHRIPLGSNIEPRPPQPYDRDQWRVSLGVKPGQVLLGYFGFLNASKGGEELISVLAGLVERGIDARLLMIGGRVGDVDPTNKAYAEKVAAQIEARGLTERVSWTGHVSPEEVSANLLAVDVMVMLYRDGVSFRRTTLISALRHGRPVVTTRPELPLPEIESGRNMILTAPGDVEGATEAVAQLALNLSLRAHISEGALALGRSFDWDRIAAQTARLYAVGGE
jgi:glycosyltransferase involved in cell wall biosynthesis